MERRKYLFKGRVQGVGFRFRCFSIANELKLTGFVKNEYDGSVSMEVQGKDAAIPRKCRAKDCRLIDIALFHITIRHIDILIICICVRKICPDAKKGSPGKSQNYPYHEQPFRDISLCLKDEMSAYINDCKKQKDNCYLQ